MELFSFQLLSLSVKKRQKLKSYNGLDNWFVVCLDGIILQTYITDLDHRKHVGLNVIHSGRKYTGKDWVRLKVTHYPLQMLSTLLLPVYSLVITIS